MLVLALKEGGHRTRLHPTRLRPHVDVRNGHPQICQLLINAGADVKVKVTKHTSEMAADVDVKVTKQEDETKHDQKAEYEEDMI